MFGAAATVIAVIVLLLELMMLRSQDVWEQLRLYALGSAAVAVLAVATAASGHGNGSLYVLGAATIAFKALLFPLGIAICAAPASRWTRGCRRRSVCRARS